jgi:cytoskeletal protein CcmA (bactofilin family)
VRDGRRSERGFALLSAIAFLVLVLALGGGLVQQALQELGTADRAKKETRAFNQAEAGVDYAAWQLYNNQGMALPATWARSDLEGGTFSVVASEHEGEAGLVDVLSTGYSQNGTAQIKVVGQFLPTGPSGHNHVFDYALFSDADVRMNGNATVTGDVHGNGNVRFNGNANIDGDLSAGGTIRLSGNCHVTGDTTPSVPRVGMPVIDLAYYQSIATAIYPDEKSFNGNFTLDGIIYVNGDANFNGNFSGSGTIVVAGQARINGNVRLVSPSDAFAIVASGGVRVNGNCTIDGWIYTHNVDVPGQFQGNGNATINGGVVADVLSVNGNITVHYGEPTVELPGEAGAPAQFDAFSWRRVR